MIQDTSIKAYRQDALPTLSERQEAVVGALEALGTATNSELAHRLNWSINRVTPRVYELRKAGRVIEAGKRPCKITGRTAYEWILSKEQLSLPI